MFLHEADSLRPPSAAEEYVSRLGRSQKAGNPMTRRQRLLRIALPLLAMAALAVAVGLSAYDAGRTETTRFRNALLAKAGSAAVPTELPTVLTI